MNLIVEGRIARTVTGPDNERLEPGGWDVLEFAGKQAIIQMVDNSKGGWGHITADRIVQTDRENPKKVSMVYECPSINKRFMHIPIGSGVKNSRVNISVDGAWQRELSISPTSDNPDNCATLEVGQWKGKKLTLTAEDVYSNSKWSELIKLSDEMADEATVYAEKYRPQFHFTARRSGIGGANGLVYLNGEYHLFSQHWPFQGANAIGPISIAWAHAISTDLVHWVEYPVAIWPDKLGVPFSGSAVVDWKNTAGLVKNPVIDKNGRLKNPAIVLFYTSEPMLIRTGGNTTQSMVYSLDSGRTWIPYAGNPVVPYIVKENRDPEVFWYEDRKNPGNPNSGRWIMDSLSREGANVFGLKINGQTILCDLDQKQVKMLDLAAPLNVVSNKIKLRVILDRMSIEVFVNDGAFRFTKPFVPEDGMQPGLQVFGKKGLATVQLNAYQLQSIWKQKARQ